jgi:hypothetical protein
MNTLRGALAIMRSEWRFGALQFIGLPMLAVLFGAWLWIQEATWWELGLQMLMAAMIAAATVWLQANTMSRYRTGESGRAHVFVVFTFCVLLTLLMYWVAGWSNFLAQLTPYLYSKMSHGVRETIGLKNLGAFFAFVQSAIFWWALPALLLPFGIEWASDGVRRTQYRRCLRVLGSAWYRLWMTAPAVVAAWIPGLLTGWKPDKGLAVQITSAILRIGLAYAIALVCWVFAIAVTAWWLRAQGVVATSGAERVGGDPAVQPA